MLSNSRLIRGVDERIAQSRINAERAVQIEIDEIAESFAAMRDPYLAARIEDIRVVGTRLIRNLIKKPYVAYSAVPDGGGHSRRRADPGRYRADGPGAHRRVRCGLRAAPKATPRSSRARSACRRFSRCPACSIAPGRVIRW